MEGTRRVERWREGKEDEFKRVRRKMSEWGAGRNRDVVDVKMNGVK